MSGTRDTENKLLNELVKDCIMYRLTESEALEYIKFRHHAISLASYKSRKGKVQSDQSSQIWLNHFTRIGFVNNQKQQIEVIEKIQSDSLKQLYLECAKQDRRDEGIIFRLKEDIRENTKLLSEFGLGMPIIAAIKAKLEEATQIQKQRYNNNNYNTIDK